MEKEGAVGLKLRKRGRPTGDGRMLTLGQEKEIRKRIEDKPHDQLKMLLRAVDPGSGKKADRTEILGPDRLRTVGKSRPVGLHAAETVEQVLLAEPEARVNQRLKEIYPGIEARAKAEKAEIHLGDARGQGLQEVDHEALGAGTGILEVQIDSDHIFR